MNNSRKQIGVALSAGGMSSLVFHAPLISDNPEFQLLGVLERSNQSVSEKYDITSYSGFEQILENEQVDLVVVNSVNELHYPQAKAALLASKNVVVEKPFVLEYEQGKELIELSAAKGKVLTVFQNRRWDSDFLTVRKVADSGRLGNLIAFEARFDRFRNTIAENTWKEADVPGGGILYNLGSHLIDQALCLFGSPKSVYATLLKERKGSAIYDAFKVIIDFEGKAATLSSSYLVKVQTPKFALFGDAGAFVKYGEDPQEAQLKRGKLPNNTPDFGLEPNVLHGVIDDAEGRRVIKSERGNYALFYQNVAEAINHQAEVLVSAASALEVIRVINACYESHSKGKKIML